MTATRTTLALLATVTAMSSGDSFITPGLPSQRRARGHVNDWRESGSRWKRRPKCWSATVSLPQCPANVELCVSRTIRARGAASRNHTGPRHRVCVVGSVRCDPPSVVVNGLPDHPYQRPAVPFPGNRWRTSGRTPFVIAATTHCRDGRWVHDRHHRRVATEHQCRTFRLHGYPGGTVRRPIAGSRDRGSRCSCRCRYRPGTRAKSLRPVAAYARLDHLLRRGPD